MTKQLITLGMCRQFYEKGFIVLPDCQLHEYDDQEPYVYDLARRTVDLHKDKWDKLPNDPGRLQFTGGVRFIVNDDNTSTMMQTAPEGDLESHGKLT